MLEACTEAVARLAQACIGLDEARTRAAQELREVKARTEAAASMSDGQHDDSSEGFQP